MSALKAMQWVIVLTMLMLYACAIVFTHLVGKSLFSLFKLMNGDTNIVRSIDDTLGGKMLFVCFMILANWAILAILTSVVSENMISASTKITEDEKERKAMEIE